jgi:hypothetical protein
VLRRDGERPLLPAEQVRVERGEQPRGRAGGHIAEIRDLGQAGAGVAERQAGPRREVLGLRLRVPGQVAAAELADGRVAVEGWDRGQPFVSGHEGLPPLPRRTEHDGSAQRREHQQVRSRLACRPNALRGQALGQLASRKWAVVGHGALDQVDRAVGAGR